MRLLWKLLSGALAVVVVLVVGIALWSLNGTRNISAAADQFRLPEGWVVLSERVEPPDLVCFGGNACPSLMCEWRVPTAMTSSDFSKLMASSGWSLTIKDSCEQQPGVSFRSCKAVGQVDGYSAQLFYETLRANPATGTLTLFLQ